MFLLLVCLQVPDLLAVLTHTGADAAVGELMPPEVEQ